MTARGGAPLEGLHILEVSSQAAGGVKAHLWQSARVLARAGAHVRVAAPASVLDGGGPAANTVAHELHAAGSLVTSRLEIGSRPSLADLTALRRLRRLVREAEVVHAHGLRAGALAVLAARGSGRGVVVTLHNLPVGSLPVRLMGRLLARMVARGARSILAVSPDLADYATSLGARETELAVIPAPPRPTQGESNCDAAGAASVMNEEIWAQGCLRILTVARLAPQKGLDLLLDAAALLRQALPGVPWQWAIAGEGPLREHLEARIAADGLPVRLLGRRADVGALMAQAEVIVQTSLWEGQPLTMQEALQSGTPTLATDVGGTACTTRGGATLVTPEAGELARALARLVADPQARARAAEVAREAAALLPGEADLAVQLARVLGAAAQS